MRSSSVDALVELVVAHGVEVEPDLVHGLDRRLVVEQRRQQRAGADQVAGRRRSACWGSRWRACAAGWRGRPRRPRGRRTAGDLRDATAVPVGGSRLPWKSLMPSSWTETSFDGLAACAAGTAIASAASAASASPRMRAPLRVCEICIRFSPWSVRDRTLPGARLSTAPSRPTPRLMLPAAYLEGSDEFGAVRRSYLLPTLR